MKKFDNYLDDLGLAGASSDKYTHASIIDDRYGKADPTRWWFWRV